MNTKKISATVQHVIEPSYVRIATVAVLLVAVIAAYLSMINSTTALGAQLSELENEYDQQLEYNRDMQLVAAQYQSIANLQERLASLPLAEVAELDYVIVNTEGDAVAKR